MKKSVIWPICLFLLTLGACQEQVVDYGLGDYYEEIATAVDTDDFLLDNGKTVHNMNPEYRVNFEAGTRVYLRFAYEEGSDTQIRLSGLFPITQGNLQAVEENYIFQQENDPVRLESAWIGSHYLNLHFYMEYSSQTHALMLLTDVAQSDQSELHLYLRHNKNNDPAGHWKYLRVSYDLSKVLGEPQGDRTIQVHFHTTNYGDKTSIFTY
jgi:hypothetical protein